MVLDSHKRALKLVEFAKVDGLEAGAMKSISDLPNTISKRNKLAHWKRSEETDSHITLVCDGKADYRFDQPEAAKMRKSINYAASALSLYLEELTDTPTKK